MGIIDLGSVVNRSMTAKPIRHVSIVNSTRVQLIPTPDYATMDGAPPVEEDFSSLSIPDRLSHKNWKARVSAYESLVQTFQRTASESDPAFKHYINNPDTLKRMVTDSNAVAQEKGVECVVAFVKFAGESAASTREAVLPAIVDKCIGSSRNGTKLQSLELLLQYVEMENTAAGAVVRSS
jgi:cytoskeleton-associated protein 5